MEDRKEHLGLCRNNRHLTFSFVNRTHVAREQIIELKDFENKKLTSSDRFIRYQCKKAYTAYLKNHKDGTDFVMDMLLDQKKSEHHLICLEICVEILSRQCEYCQHYAEEMSSKLYQYCCTFFNEQQTLNSQCTFCLLKVFCKYIKLLRNLDCKPAWRFIKMIISDFKNQLIDILFRFDFTCYVTRQVMRFLSSILRIKNLIMKDMLGSEIMKLNTVLVDKLLEADLEGILYTSHPGGFSGQELTVDHRGEAIDVVRVMEWSYLIISSATFCTNKESTKHTGLLIKLDRVLKQKYGGDKDILLSWIPEIYSNQDDMWIDVLYTLMSVKSEGCSPEESASIQNHWYFLQFISAMGYDHQIFVDFLTSPETKFLAYFVCYLKCLISSWTKFREVAQTFQARLETSNSVIAKHIAKQRNHVSYTETVISIENKNDYEIHTCKKDRNYVKNQNNGISISNENVVILSANDDTVVEVPSEDNEDELKTALSAMTNASKSDDATSKSIGEPFMSGGLGLISKMYNDSDSESENSEDRLTCDQADSTDTEADLINQDAISDVDAFIHSSIVQNMADKYITIKEDETHKEMNADYCHSDSVQKQITTYKNVSNEPGLDVSKSEEMVQKEDVDLGETDEDKGITDFGETDVLDSVMSALIRVRLKLERVWENGVLSYNPKPLISLLQQVEHLYEN